MAVKCGKGHGYHESSAVVRVCYNGGDAPLVDMGETVNGEPRATRFQVTYLEDLLHKHGLRSAKDPERYGKYEISPLIALLRETKPSQELSKQDLSGFGLEYADGASLAAGKPRDFSVVTKASGPKFDPQTLEAGIYLLEDKIYKVLKAVHGSGRMYAKVLIKGEDGQKSSFRMANGMINNIRPEHKMTLDQAKEFGPIYGCCVRCGRVLTKESSIDQFMGDWCASQF